jgi:DNA polymerase III delta prime subunit
MLQIAQQEGLKVNEIAMEALIESCNSDIRLVLNTLQVRASSVVHQPLPKHCLATQMRRLNSDTLQFDDVKSTATKDLELGAFNATDKCVTSPLGNCATC